MLILPGDPGFEETLLRPPPNWRQAIAGSDRYAFVVRAGSGLVEPVADRDLLEYLEGGEYDDRLDAIGDDDDEGLILWHGNPSDE
jgi:hypothetical protein